MSPLRRKSFLYGGNWGVSWKVNIILQGYRPQLQLWLILWPNRKVLTWRAASPSKLYKIKIWIMAMCAEQQNARPKCLFNSLEMCCLHHTHLTWITAVDTILDSSLVCHLQILWRVHSSRALALSSSSTASSTTLRIWNNREVSDMRFPL